MRTPQTPENTSPLLASTRGDDREAMRIEFINMPFANIHIPSIGMTQIKSVLESRFAERISVKLRYFNQDFAKFLGIDVYQEIVTKSKHLKSGVGAWIFRQLAFPEAADNSEEFFKRFYPYDDRDTQHFRGLILERRQALRGFLEGLLEEHDIYSADIVGFSSMFNQNLAIFAMSELIRSKRPDALIIVGGANCESPMGEAIIQNIRSIDFVFSGPSLKSFPSFVEAHLTGAEAEKHSINGVFSRKNLDRVQAAGSCHSAAALLEPSRRPVGIIGEELPISQYLRLDYDSFLDDLEEKFPEENIEPVLLFETSRGCWWGEKSHCTFCGLNDLTIAFRSMPPDLATRQFEDIFRYKERCSRYMSVDNILPKSYFESVLPKLNVPRNASIFYEIKSNLTKDNFEALRKGSVKIVQPGLESLSTDSLRVMKKGATSFVQLQFLLNCVQYDVFPVWNLLIGTPGEPVESYAFHHKIIPLITHLHPPTGVVPVEFHRFSPNFENADALGLKLVPASYTTFCYPLPDAVLRQMVWNFEDTDANAVYLQDVLKWIGRLKERVTYWQSRWYTQEEDGEPKLYIRDTTSGRQIYDSRFLPSSIYEIQNSTYELLKRLDRPTALQQIESWDADFKGGRGLTEEIAYLREKKLLFEEDGKIMSLVLPTEPPPRASEFAALSSWSLDASEFAAKKFNLIKDKQQEALRNRILGLKADPAGNSERKTRRVSFRF